MVTFEKNCDSEQPLLNSISNAITAENGSRLDQPMFGPRSRLPTGMSHIHTSPLPLPHHMYGLTHDLFQSSYPPSLQSEGSSDWGFAALHRTSPSLHDEIGLALYNKPRDQNAYPLFAGVDNTELDTTASLLSPMKWNDTPQLFLQSECFAPTASSANVEFDCHSPQPLFGFGLQRLGTYPITDGQGQDDVDSYSTLQLSTVTPRNGSQVATPGLHDDTTSQSSPDYEREEAVQGIMVYATSRTSRSRSKSNQDHKCIEKNYRDRLNSGFKNLIGVLEACGDDISGGCEDTSVYNALRKQSKGAVLQLATARLQLLQRENRLLISELKLMKGISANL